MNADLPPAWRVPLLAMAMLALVIGAAAGLTRMGWAFVPAGEAAVLGHGPLMICGFFGTVISLERAVAFGRALGYVAPLCSGAGALVLVVGGGSPAGPVLLVAGSLALLVLSVATYRRQRALHTLTLVIGAAAWFAGTLAWWLGAPVGGVVPLWMAFLILTIAGERLELSRFLPPSPVAERIFAGLVVVIVAAALAAAAGQGAASTVYAAALLALAAWLLRQDIARRTVRDRGLTRFIAVCLLSGYLWMGIGALIQLIGGMVPGTGAYDAGLHAVLLGFVFAMVFGHAPIIFPAVLGVRLPYHALFYGPLAVLHLSVAVRVVGALAGLPAMRAVGGLLNVTALALFVLTMVGAMLRGARASA